MAIENYGQNVAKLEELLQKITATMTSAMVLEKLPPSDLWNRSESDVVAFQSLAGRLRDSMLVLKPEIAPTIRRRTEALLQPLNSFRDILFRKSDSPLANSKVALEELRVVVMEGSNFLDLAKDVKKNPSESISAVLKLKEVYEAKEYLSAVPAPEAAYVRFVALGKTLEKLRLRVSDLERALGELRENINSVQEEMSKFRPQPIEPSEQKTAKPAASTEKGAYEEPTLVHEDEE